MFRFEQIVNRRNLRLLFAAAFLFVMLVEWGSHSLAFVHAVPTEGFVVVSGEIPHQDPCKTMVHNGEQGRQSNTPTISHYLPYQNRFWTGTDVAFNLLVIAPEPPLDREDAHRLYRPPDPPFLPPEIS